MRNSTYNRVAERKTKCARRWWKRNRATQSKSERKREFKRSRTQQNRARLCICLRIVISSWSLAVNVFFSYSLSEYINSSPLFFIPSFSGVWHFKCGPVISVSFSFYFCVYRARSRLSSVWLFSAVTLRLVDKFTFQSVPLSVFACFWTLFFFWRRLFLFAFQSRFLCFIFFIYKYNKFLKDMSCHFQQIS